MRITLVVDESLSHANVIIYDKQSKRLIRFEPYGDWEFIDSYHLDNMIIKLFSSVIEDKITYVRPGDYLNDAKLQTVSLGDNPKYRNIGDPEGYCLAWCYWFLELKLQNPDINEKELITSTVRKIIDSSDSDDPTPLLSHIRDYTKHLDSEKNKIFDNMGVDKHDIYKLAHNKVKLTKIKTFIDNYTSSYLLNMYNDSIGKKSSD